MNAKAAYAIRFALALAVKEKFFSGTLTCEDCMRDSERWIRQSVPRRYQRLALRALTRARQSYYDVYNEHYDREN